MNENGSGNPEKHALWADLAKKVQALDNPVKLSVLSLLVESGSLSITDIAKKLNINFSTAHKYLEQLEAADLVTSKQVADNRLKRIFTLNKFEILLSPESFSNNFKPNGKSGGKYTLLNAHSKVSDFDSKEFLNRYASMGIPISLIAEGLEHVKSKLYDQMSLLELENEFSQFLREKQQKLTEAVDSFESKGLSDESTFSSFLKKRNEEGLIQSAIDGNLHIECLDRPNLLNFSHDLNVMAMLGLEKPPSNFKEFISEILNAIKQANEVVFSKHCLDSFNVFASPLLKNLKDREIEDVLKAFLSEVDKLGIRLYIGLDIGLARFLDYVRALAPDVSTKEREKLDVFSAEFVKKTVSYKDYTNDAKRIAKIMLNLIKKEKYKNILPVLKFWEDWQTYDINDDDLCENFYIANMLPAWQGTNATYLNSIRIDSLWKYWYRCVRVGEVQCIAINLPRIALQTMAKEKFFDVLKQRLDEAYKILILNAEAVTAEINTRSPKIIHKVPGRGQYFQLDDCLYSISLCGVEEAVKILTGKSIDEDVKFAKKILDFCDEFARGKSEILLRTIIKENTNENVAARFYHLDSQKFKVPVSGYSSGISTKVSDKILALQENILGGHCAKIKKEDIQLKILLKKNWGLIKVI